ncbi:hypothetical protein F2P81_018371 [Scophthalmus maximus]|uniref:RING-type domain-containing protein n=1 Tax=Scophthalmus maximus TaxID=52904 RepID=A0A6A4S229_SCOMX|nr:hypothetical protein F2P81_018371 [Scophthalmus maximus]
MCSELECGICYRTYNAARRCPRELRCGHSFCESCLRALSRPGGAIACPLCRRTTAVSGEGAIRAELRVDEWLLHLLLDAGLLDREEEEEEEEEEREEEEEEEEGAPPPPLVEPSAEESDSSAGARGGRLRRLWRKARRAISGKSSRSDCMTNEDLRNFALMSCYMF